MGQNDKEGEGQKMEKEDKTRWCYKLKMDQDPT